ncbi:MAG: hypothetical protein ACI8PB_003580 [Desulforhopalus sp.]|jgi:hypothetical protein
MPYVNIKITNENVTKAQKTKLIEGVVNEGTPPFNLNGLIQNQKV